MNETKKMLIVDDVEMNRAILALQFRDRFTILEAANGREALDVLEANDYAFSIILLDVVMPVMDGFAVLNVLRGEPRASGIPVIVTTAAGETEFELKAIELGATDYITKPVDPRIV